LASGKSIAQYTIFLGEEILEFFMAATVKKTQPSVLAQK
jgi:hypothetical protein